MSIVIYKGFCLVPCGIRYIKIPSLKPRSLKYSGHLFRKEFEDEVNGYQKPLTQILPLRLPDSMPDNTTINAQTILPD